MVLITESNKIDVALAEQTLDRIFDICDQDFGVSYRPFSQIGAAHDEGRLLLAVRGNEVLGWLLVMPYTQEFQELAAVFVEEKYRSRAIATSLVKKAVALRKYSLIVTFNSVLSSKLSERRNTKQSSAIEAIWRSGGKFITDRLSLRRVRDIIRHYRSSRPSYWIIKR